MSKKGKSTSMTEQKFPYSMFPVKLIHLENGNTKTCYFQNKSHVEKYIERSKLKKNQYELYFKDEKSMENVGKINRRKSVPKKPRSRQNSSS